MKKEIEKLNESVNSKEKFEEMIAELEERDEYACTGHVETVVLMSRVKE
ncbi:MAG: hypothetical protein PUC44_05080 [Eubacteriales bacterium]|nr:hypothetical protein [Eubacteriales bacterium]